VDLQINLLNQAIQELMVLDMLAEPVEAHQLDIVVEVVEQVQSELKVLLHVVKVDQLEMEKILLRFSEDQDQIILIVEFTLAVVAVEQ
tara:strand:- start:155 stop:418 length:264 start_codon:yes stop_codon:yes gene_type:complete